MFKKIIQCTLYSIIFLLISLVFVRIDITQRISVNNNDILIDKNDKYTIGIQKIDWWENFRGFPFQMQSFPYSHSSTKVNKMIIIYNFIFYFSLCILFKIWQKYVRNKYK